jgi:hypothetical protein
MNTIKTEQPRHSDALLSALERTLAHHDLRLRPGQSLADVADAFKENQIELSEQHGYLSATQHGQPAHLNVAVEACATKYADKFFPREVAGVKSRDQLDVKGRIAYIKEFGLDAFERLPAKAPQQTTVVLDPRRLKRDQWLSLDRSTRAQLAAQWGADAIGAIMGRK